MSDAWSKICWSLQPSEPAYYIVDYWILRLWSFLPLLCCMIVQQSFAYYIVDYWILRLWSFLPLLCCMIVQQSFDPLQIFLLLEL